jgi:hypothetical protein
VHNRQNGGNKNTHNAIENGVHFCLSITNSQHRGCGTGIFVELADSALCGCGAVLGENK